MITQTLISGIGAVSLTAYAATQVYKSSVNRDIITTKQLQIEQIRHGDEDWTNGDFTPVNPYNTGRLIAEDIDSISKQLEDRTDLKKWASKIHLLSNEMCSVLEDMSDFHETQLSKNNTYSYLSGFTGLVATTSTLLTYQQSHNVNIFNALVGIPSGLYMLYYKFGTPSTSIKEDYEQLLIRVQSLRIKLN